MMRLNVFFVVLLLVVCPPANSSITPQEVVVVYNANSIWNDSSVNNISKVVADYYCIARGIPHYSKIAINVPSTSETIAPDLFTGAIANPLKAFLSSRSGFDIDNPGSDPTKAIVLCYGVPLKISGNGRYASVESALSLMFSDAPWGREPMGCYGIGGYSAVDNPYYESTVSPSQRQKPADFGEFRASGYNSRTEAAPRFSIIRMLDTTGRAIAAGERGLLYKRDLVDDQWRWLPIADPTKQFLAHHVSDVFVSGQNIVVSTIYGAIIQSTNGGQTWTQIRAPSAPLRSTDVSPTPWIAVGRDGGGVCWAAGAREGQSSVVGMKNFRNIL